MIHIKQNDRCTKIKERLAHALGNTIEIIKILKEVTLCENIDLLFYDNAKKMIQNSNYFNQDLELKKLALELL